MYKGTGWLGENTVHELTKEIRKLTEEMKEIKKEMTRTSD